MKTHRVSARGLSVAVHEIGRPDAPVVVAFHGFLDVGLSWRAVAEALSADLRFLLIDFRGHGHSDWVGAGMSYYFPDYHVDVRQVLNALGVNEFFVLGHSMGGSVSLGTASMYPDRVRALVLLEGMGPPGEDADSAPLRLSRFVQALDRPDVLLGPVERRAARKPMSLDEAIDRMMRTNPGLTRDRAESLVPDAVEAVPGGWVWRFDPLHRIPSARPYRADELLAYLALVRAPVLSLFGSETHWKMGDLGQRHRTLVSARFGLVAGAGHNIHHDRPTVVAEAVRLWFLGDRAAPLPEGITETGPEMA